VPQPIPDPRSSFLLREDRSEAAARCSWCGNEAAAGLHLSVSQTLGWEHLLWTSSVFQVFFKLLGD